MTASARPHIHNRLRAGRGAMPVLLVLAALLLPACGPKERPEAGKRILFGVVTQDRSGPESLDFIAGARAAALELGKRFGAEVALDWQAPDVPDPARQALAVDSLIRSGVAGIALCVSGSDPAPASSQALTALGAAVERASVRQIPVVCAGEDLPKSGRFAFLGTDDIQAGILLLRELAQALGDRGGVAVLAGPRDDPRLGRRLDGLRDELKRHPDLHLVPDGVVHCSATPEEAAVAAAERQARDAPPEGWAFLGPWPLRAKDPLRWKPAEVKAVSLEALPAETNLLESGALQALLVPRFHERGSKSVKVLLQKLLLAEAPDGAVTVDLPETVLSGNARAYLRAWGQRVGRPVEEPPPPTAPTPAAPTPPAAPPPAEKADTAGKKS